MYRFSVKTGQRCEMIEITAQVQELLNGHQTYSSLAIIFVPHTTAGITINENADSDVRIDLLMGLERIVPLYKDFRHQEGNSDAHLKASLLGTSVTIPVENGRLILGTWQGIYLAEFDGPRHRNVLVTFL